jgi:hypothetical protein
MRDAVDIKAQDIASVNARIFRMERDLAEAKMLRFRLENEQQARETYRRLAAQAS